MNHTSAGYSLDDKLIGFSYMLITTVIACFYVPCLYVIGFNNDLKNHPCLKIMFHLGLCDLINMAGHWIFGFWALTGIGYTVPFWINKTITGLLDAFGWQVYIVLINILALNRCLKIGFINGHWHDLIFGQKATKIWIGLVWIQGVCWFIFRMSPWITMLYNPYHFVNMLDQSSPMAKFLVMASWWHCFINQGLTAVWYVITIVAMRLQTVDLSNMSEQTRASEKALLKQAIIICATLIIVDQYWHTVIYFSFDVLGIYAGMVGLYLLMVNYAINPIIYLTINKTIAMEVRKMMPFSQSTRVVPISTKRTGPPSKRTGHPSDKDIISCCSPQYHNQ